MLNEMNKLAKMICPAIYNHTDCESCDLFDEEKCLPFTIAKIILKEYQPMNKTKSEDAMRALAWYEVVGKNIGSVTIPYDELKAIVDLLREKDARINELELTLLGVMHSVDKTEKGSVE